ncbi:MAG: hypothetical protein LBH78_02380, partial [Rickettsiales bacterium]|nr:hypothetical protein [Rickettsiales bacterium]
MRSKWSYTNSHYTESGWTTVEKSYTTKTKKLLDNLRRYPYHSIEAIIYLQSVQIKRQKNLAYLASH